MLFLHSKEFHIFIKKIIFRFFRILILMFVCQSTILSVFHCYQLPFIVLVTPQMHLKGLLTNISKNLH